MRSQVVDIEDVRLHARAHDLALVGEISLLLNGDGVFEGVGAALQRLGEHVGADATELFVSAPDGSEVLMVSHLGADTESFCQQVRFPAGEGFPGIVLRTASTLWTRSLPAEVDFVRSRIQALGYRSAVCVPLRGGSRVGGCILLAWKEARSDLDHVARTAGLAAQPMAAAVELSRARVEGRSGLLARADPPQEAHLVDRFRAEAHADTAALFPARRGCPVCGEGGIQVLGGRAGWPRQCIAAGCTAKARYCVPLGTDEGLWGVATVAFSDEVPVPVTRHLPEALWVARTFAAPEGKSEHEARPAPSVEAGAHIDVRCLGRFQTSVDGVVIQAGSFQRAKARELLALLVCAARPVPREELWGALWPGTSEAPARNRFHVTLSALRSALRGPGDGKDPIHRDGTRYHLDRRAGVAADLWRFRDRIAQAREWVSQGRDGPDVVAALQHAVGQYQGDPFGGEFHGAWADQVAGRTRRDVLWATDQLSTAQRRAGDLEAAATTLRRAEEIDPLREDLRRRLMEVLIQLGRPGEAEESYLDLKMTLAASLGAAPAPSTVRLHEALRSSP